MARRYLGEQGGQEFQAQARRIFAHWTRIAIRPEEVRILDFQDAPSQCMVRHLTGFAAETGSRQSLPLIPIPGG